MRRMQEGAYPRGKGAPSFITQPGRALHGAACPELPPLPSSWPAHWPWDPQLLQDTHGHWKSQLDEKHICGTVLVRPRWVLTAAHCEVAWNLSDFRVVLGAHNLNTPEPTQQVFNITRAVPYSLYNAQQDIHDIQLLKLHTSARRTSSVRPTPLPGRNRYLRPGSQCHVMGWGETTGHDDPSAALLEATVVVQPRDTCNASWRGALTQDMLCASTGTRERRGVCAGDSGGPLFCRGQLQGVVSFSSMVCGSPHFPDVYTHVSAYVSWIRDVLQHY
ncbi:serine protease 57-like isoform X6 [Equus quagga]|uniref:serine protease 57-like isoform X6 n=1 Tax=Equus quagga TaxID=89248 RepID=UPI001EE1D530|nr:serine protease 57-like isoform X6 [Equus quagga]